MERRLDRRTALQAGEDLLKTGRIPPITHPQFLGAWELFRVNKRLSFTDATNIAMMRSLGVTRIATFDEGFRSVSDITVLG